MPAKRLLRVQPAQRDDIADLVTRRPLPGPGLDQLDPFLFLNHHGPQTYPAHNNGLPFGPHPHRGFETVSFILQGEMAHLDSGGHESVIEAGGVQWMTAGSGLVHAEISPAAFKRAGGPLEILQLWVNLPPALKMTAPRYIGLQTADIPKLSHDEGRTHIHLIAGELDGVVGPIDSLTGVFMSTVHMAAGGRFHLDGLAGRNVFLYLAKGAIRLDGREIPAFHLPVLDLEGDSLEIEATADTVLAFGHAEPIGAPVVAHGPFVMNTVEEIHAAIRDYQAGKFGMVRL